MTLQRMSMDHSAMSLQEHLLHKSAPIAGGISIFLRVMQVYDRYLNCI